MLRYPGAAAALLILVSLSTAPAAAAGTFYVAPGGSGSGSRSAPFGRILDGIAAARPGDDVVISPGTYHERLTTVRDGSPGRPIVVRSAEGRGTVVVTASGRVASIFHTDIVLDGLVLDGQFGIDDIVRVRSGAARFTLRDSEVRRTSRDGIDIDAAHDVLIERALVHHTLNAADGRTDAHGIVAGAVRGLTIRDTEVHTFSGDAFQIDPGRAAPGWTDVLIEGCRFWLRPLPEPVNGFAAGVVPGENAVDTKAGPNPRKSRLTIRNTEAFGFRGGLIGNMAAFNIKESVDTTIDGVTVHTSDIAFRLRAPATVRIQNAVVHSVATGVRYEDDIQGVRIFNSTFGAAVGRTFQGAEAARSVLEVRNVAMLAAVKPAEASGPTNLALTAAAFVDPANHDYRLAAGSRAIDRGEALAEVSVDREGTKRPQGAAYDVGAYERGRGPGRGLY